MRGLISFSRRGRRWAILVTVALLLALGAPRARPVAQAGHGTPLADGSLELVYAETASDGLTTLWAAPLADPQARRALWTVRTLPGYGIRAAVAPDGSRFAALLLPPGASNHADRFSGAELWLGGDGLAPRRVAQRLNLYTLLWSPDSTTVLVQREVPALPSRTPTPYSTDLIAIAADGSGARRLVADNAAYGVDPVGWSADGKSLVYDRIDLDGIHTLWSVDVASGLARPGAVLGRGPILSLRPSPDGGRLAVLMQVGSGPARYSLDLVSATTGQHMVVRQGARGSAPDDYSSDKSDGYYVPIWAPDGATLTVGGPAGIETVDPANGEGRMLVERDASGVLSPLSWSPDGHWLALARRRSQGTDVLVLGPEGNLTSVAEGGRAILTFAGWLARPVTLEAGHLPESAPLTCPVSAAWGRQPYPSELGPTFDLAGGNLLGDLGPPLPLVNYGLPPNMTQIDPFVPCVLLKAIGYTEAAWQQFNAGYGQYGWTLISFDCGYGIMQITSYMGGGGGFDPARVAAEPAYDIGTGTLILIDKWNWVPFIGVNDPHIAEEWYYATWAYNGWGYVNNPNNPIYPPDRPPWTGAPGQNRSDYPYQELVWGYAANPPGSGFWSAVALTLPDRSLITDPPPYWIPELSPWHTGTCGSTVLPYDLFFPLMRR